MSASMVTPAPKKVRSRMAGMNPWQVFRIAWRAILGNPLRSILTTLGVIIGVAAVVALTMVGQGSTANITRTLQSLGTNLLTIGSATGGRGGALVWCALAAPRPSPWPMPRRSRRPLPVAWPG
jgi:putative ABC transport system permease protein